MRRLKSWLEAKNNRTSGKESSEEMLAVRCQSPLTSASATRRLWRPAGDNKYVCGWDLPHASMGSKTPKAMTSRHFIIVVTRVNLVRIICHSLSWSCHRSKGTLLVAICEHRPSRYILVRANLYRLRHQNFHNCHQLYS